MYIDGEWTESSDNEMLDSLNPYTQKIWAQIPQAAESDVQHAIASAKQAFLKADSKLQFYYGGRQLELTPLYCNHFLASSNSSKE